ncbi:thiamine phosphate synthase [Alterisphingorhabdus coralli]|uniref:Thiamine phosphate synthase n=1 Tax=Alterisphingorhabdus coralli TaxID=3071408 RepID=A0AA97F6X5_9SPHN|nr:thiamine phosphate synthase [Parasphingorhabdus sp. SCSIO 66989]WOE75061.1 thiamine phosphate synthase [Parasphingorhabdus sp. SCSIO 66989]
MPPFQSFSDFGLPSLWLFTDARNADVLDKAIAGLPPGSGVVFRHYHLPEQERCGMFAKLMRRHARRDHIWLWSGDAVTARVLHADGCYGSSAGPPSQRSGLWLATAHNSMELTMAARRGADGVFLSPVYPTRSHAGGTSLGPMRFAALARHRRCPVYALGGVTRDNWARIAPFCDGWGAIDGLSER